MTVRPVLPRSPHWMVRHLVPLQHFRDRHSPADLQMRDSPPANETHGARKVIR